MDKLRSCEMVFDGYDGWTLKCELCPETVIFKTEHDYNSPSTIEVDITTLKKIIAVYKE